MNASKVAIVVLALALAGCSGNTSASGDPTGTPSADVAAAPVLAASASPTLPPVQLRAAEVIADCDNPDFSSADEIVIDVPATGLPDFRPAWSTNLTSCRVTRTDDDDTPIESAAYKASKYDDGDITTLYEICIESDPDDVLAAPDFAMSDAQIAEMTAAMMLCPNHPQAKAWRKSISRGQAELALEKNGLTFWSGVYLVGKEIKPGTYVVTGDIENCYWERQNRNGGIIANDFVLNARRVQVTIKSSDYAFSSDGCGQWKRV